MPDLHRLLAADPGLAKLLASVRSTLDTAPSHDPGHDLAHSLRVALWTVRIGGEEVDPREAVAAALCHDLVSLPKDSPERAQAGPRSARAAEGLLRAAGFSDAAVARVQEAIASHGFSRGIRPASALGRALQDADRLEALGAVGILRTLAVGGSLGRALFDADDPWAERRELDDGAYTLDHFFTKLLTLQHTMCTPRGAEEARRRSRVIEDFLRELASELEVPLPAGGGRAADPRS